MHSDLRRLESLLRASLLTGEEETARIIAATMIQTAIAEYRPLSMSRGRAITILKLAKTRRWDEGVDWERIFHAIAKG